MGKLRAKPADQVRSLPVDRSQVRIIYISPIQIHRQKGVDGQFR